MLDVLRKYVDSLAGITELPRERAEKLVTEMQKRGEVRVKDLQKLAQDLSDRSHRNRQELVKLIRREIDKQVQALGLARREDVDKLAKRVKALETKAGASAKKASTGTTAAKRKSPSSRKPQSRRGSSSNGSSRR